MIQNQSEVGESFHLHLSCYPPLHTVKVLCYSEYATHIHPCVALNENDSHWLALVVMLYHGNRKVTNIEFGTRKWDIAVKKLTALFPEGMWRTLK